MADRREGSLVPYVLALLVALVVAGMALRPIIMDLLTQEPTEQAPVQ